MTTKQELREKWIEALKNPKMFTKDVYNETFDWFLPYLNLEGECCQKCDAVGKRGSALYLKCMHPYYPCHSTQPTTDKTANEAFIEECINESFPPTKELPKKIPETMVGVDNVSRGRINEVIDYLKSLTPQTEEKEVNSYFGKKCFDNCRKGGVWSSNEQIFNPKGNGGNYECETVSHHGRGGHRTWKEEFLEAMAVLTPLGMVTHVEFLLGSRKSSLLKKVEAMRQKYPEKMPTQIILSEIITQNKTISDILSLIQNE